MVDKNSSLKNSFFDNVRQGIDQLPAFMSNILTRTTELPFEAGSDIVVEPVLRFLVPGTSPEEREKIKADIAAKDETQATFLEGARGRIQNILQLPPKSREQFDAIRLLEDDMVAIGYPKTTVMNVLNKGREFFFGPQYDIHKKVADGEIRPSELEGQDLSNYLIGFVDVADVAGIGSGVVSTIRKALSKQDFGALKNIINTLPPEKVQEVSNLLSKENKINPREKFYSDPKNFKEFKNKKELDNILRLAEIIDNTPIDKLDGSFASIIKENNLNPLLKDRGIKSGVKNNLLKYNLVSDEKFAKIELNAKEGLSKATSKAGEIGREKINQVVNNALQNNIFYKTRVELADAIGMDPTLLNSYTASDPVLKQKIDDIVIRGNTVKGQTNDPRKIFNREAAEIFSNKADLNKYFKNIDPETFKKINDLRRAGKYKVETVSPFKLFQDYMYDKFRSIKQTKGNEKLTTEDFINKYMSDQDLEDFPLYVNLELQRTNANVAGRDILNELAKNEKYRPYLLNKDNEIDYQLLQFNKTHDIPLFVTRTEGSGRLKNVGRFKGAGTETEFIQPHLQAYNYLQKNIDPYANILGDILNQEGLKKEFSKITDLKINNKDLTRKNPINQKLLDILEDYGYKPNLNKFNNQYELIEEVAGVIDGIYKDRLIRTVVPITKKSGKKDTVIFGIEDPKSVTLNQRVEIGATRLKEILDYAIENNLKPSDIKESGYLKSFKQGGEVETEQEEQSFLSKAASAVSNFIIPQAEALPLPKNFLLGDTPKLVKKTETVKQLPAPEAPILEKRYNIFDENGQKVYQSKSMDDAQQKALRLGDLEGKTFTVKEIEVPVKVKKSKTTKPGTSLVPTIVPENAIGSGNNKLFYSDLNSVINTDTGNLTIKGVTVPNDTVSMSAKDWHDWFRSKGIKEGELYDSYVRSYLNKKGGFNRETGQFTNDEKISFAEIKELVDTSPTNYIQTVSYSDEAGNLKYGNSGRQDDYISGSRTERVLWLDSKDIRGDIGSLPSEIQQYEGHRQMREVRSSDDFMAQENKLDGEPYVIGWSLGSNRIGKLNNKDIVVNVADEIQSDFLQKAASLKSDIKQEIRGFVNRSQNQQIGRNEGLDILYKKLENVFRPMPATYAQLKKSLNQLIESDAVFQKIGKMDMDDITKESFKELAEAAKIRDKALATINSTIDNIDARELFPNIPFKDQKDWVDAIIKNDVYNAAKKRFYFDENGALQINKDAPSHYGVAPNKAVRAYTGGRGVELPPDSVDRSGKMVAYDMQYGGPNLNDHTGTHFTGNVEESLNKIANAKNSKVEVGKVPFGMAGEGVDTFMIELTPDMLFPYKAYKKDGGLVKKSILYTPIVSVNELIQPIGASRW